MHWKRMEKKAQDLNQGMFYLKETKNKKNKVVRVFNNTLIRLIGPLS